MNTLKAACLLLSFFCFTVLCAQEVTVTTTDGHQHTVTYQKQTIKNNGIILDSDELLEYSSIDIIATDNFDAYERAMKKVDTKRNENLVIQFTGDQNLYALQLEKLESKRNAAHVARGAGGLMLLVGALSGDRDLYTAGAITYGAGTIARDINTDKTIAAQNDAIVDLQENQKRQEEVENIEAEYRSEYGGENVDGLYALIEKNHDRALALANVGETSKNANHRLSSVWLKALIYKDQGKEDLLKSEYDRIIVMDPEAKSIEECERWIVLLMDDLAELRKS